MGLDWDPLNRPRPGFEEEFATLVARLHAEGESTDVVDRMNEITEPVFQTLGAPRVGIDPAADDWLRGKVDADKYDQARSRMHGYYVLDLLPECDGFPVYTNYPMSPQLDRYSFRGAFLNDVEDVLGPQLFERAHRYQSAEQLEDYGEQLVALARKLARKERVMEVESRRDPGDFEEGSAESRAHILFAAGRWCLYWARRGHGLAPWF
jgi:hypothetical protein